MLKRIAPLALAAVIVAVFGVASVASAGCDDGPCPIKTPKP